MESEKHEPRTEYRVVEDPEMTTTELVICVALLLLAVFIIMAFAYTLFVCALNADAFITTYTNNTSGVSP